MKHLKNYRFRGVNYTSPDYQRFSYSVTVIYTNNYYTHIRVIPYIYNYNN